MTFSKSNLPLITELSNVVVTGLELGSAFQKAATSVPLDGNGMIIPILGQADAQWVTEGALKPIVDAPISDVELRATKMARVSLYTTEMENDIPQLVKAVKDEIAASLSRTFDKTVAGLITAPAGFSNFSASDTVNISDYASWIHAISTVKGYPTDAIVLNTHCLDGLRSLVSTVGTPLLNIVGDAKSGTINGVPYFGYIDGTTEAHGIVGPFARALWGVVDGSVIVDILRETAQLPDGTIVALRQKNMIGVLVEARVGFKVYDESEFKKITVSGFSSGS